jgi:hypothetical protein
MENKPDEEYYGELVNITNDPTRLAALWRYLLTREIGDYTRYSPPPISTEKAERIAMEIEQPHLRHARAAIELLRASKRQVFDTDEFADLLSIMSEREHENSGGEIAKIDYSRRERDGKSKPEFMAAMRSITKRDAIKLDRSLRTATHRPPQIYIMANYAELALKFLEIDKREIFDYLDQDKDRDYAKHPWKMYQRSEK